MSDTVAASRTAGAAGKLARAARASSRKMMGLTGQRRSEALLRIADGLAADREAILAANAADMEAAGYGFYVSGIMENLAKMPYDEMVEGDVVWVGTPEEVIKRIEDVQEVCEGLSEVAITVNPGGFDHWKAIKAQELFANTVIPHFSGVKTQPKVTVA